MATKQSECQALQLSDAQKCQEKATHANGIFCWFHSKQVHGLYKGYKRRNARLDLLDDEAPAYLQSAEVPLANQTFEDVQDEKTLREVQSHLFEKYVLLGKVIDARKLHHKHFYSLNVDYGHQAYLDKLSSQRHTVLRSLERLEKRTAIVLYQTEQWFTWVRQVQEEEEASREKEQKKVKQEAALFKRHWKKLQARFERKRQREEKKRQDAYLEDAYRERMAKLDETNDDEAWDPIEDMEHDKRHQYIELIKHFLWMEMDVVDADETTAPSTDLPTRTKEPAPAAETKSPSPAPSEAPSQAPSQASSQAPSKKPKKKSKGRGVISKAIVSDAIDSVLRGQKKLVEMKEGNQLRADDNREPDKNSIETEEEMRKRLSEGVKKNYDNVMWGFQMFGSMENPYETLHKTAPMAEDEVDAVVKDIRDIKLLLFCRLLLAQASMLPAALRAGSVLEFLSDAEIADSDLRDLCLKLEEPTLQDIRDACADFARDDEAELEVEVDDDGDADYVTTEDEDSDEGETFEEMIDEDSRYRHLSTRDWLSEKFIRKHERLQGTDNKNNTLKLKTKVTICGMSVWNHSSESAMSRDGWLQFSIMAKDCDLKHAIRLCRNWAEFSDLNLLTLWQYFPASNWTSWGSNRLVQQLQELGFFPYFLDFDAQQFSRNNTVSGRSQGRRQHEIIETRNILVGQMKRNDPVTRRFLQYLVLRAGELLVLVRDGKTGRVITAPPEEHLWTYRMKQGLGRASKNDWVNVLEVGPRYFELTERFRDWHLGFNDYYEVFIWDFVPCQSFMDVYNVLIWELRNAWRITHPRDVYLHTEPILRSLTRNKKTMRTRLIKPGEEIESLWDDIQNDTTEFRLVDMSAKKVTLRNESEITPYMFYNEANAAEDQVFFPDELISNKKNVPFREIRNGVNRVEEGVLPSVARHLARGTSAINQGFDPLDAMHDVMDDEDGLWALPRVWLTGIRQLRREKPSGEKRKLLKRTGLDVAHKTQLMDDRLFNSDKLEIMERDRAAGFKESLHAADLEPGSTEKYMDVQDKLTLMLSIPHSGSTDWIYFIAEILDWLKLRADYNDYVQEPAAPWPHSFIVQDMVLAFAAMAMFFPELEVTSRVTMFLKLKICESFKESKLFDPRARSKTLPDRRARTSYKFRDRQFWKKWKNVEATPKKYFTDVYPFDWSLSIRPIIARLYRAGVIAPAHFQNDREVVPGIATANTEPHRPDQLDLFISYDDPYNRFPITFPPHFLPPHRWPVLLPLARAFASAHPAARFSLLRLWSAPHCYPLMVGLNTRQSTSFLDSTARSWQWKFVPKDMPGSELSAHNVTAKRLELLAEQFGDRVVHRGDLILVMGVDAMDLMRYCTGVAFAMQTKPWLREVDLWKSFINVGLDLLEELDPFWLD